jgi:hypothetical protein
MPGITFTKENLLERKQLKAGWRVLKVKSVTEKPGTADPESTTYPVTFIVESGEDIGAPVNHWFTEKQLGRLAEFIKCFVSGDVQVGKTYELSDTVGKMVQGYVEYDIKTGFNTIKDFKPAGKTTSGVAQNA